MPSDTPIEETTAGRLESWRKRLKENHATPLLLIGVGHGERSGQLVICVPEGVDDDLLLGSLLFAIETLKPGSIPQHHGESREFRR